MDTVINALLWVSTLNAWGKTFVACASIAAVWAACGLMAALFLRGGYRSNDDKEDAP
jgi:hypothetical protein